MVLALKVQGASRPMALRVEGLRPRPWPHDFGIDYITVLKREHLWKP